MAPSVVDDLKSHARILQRHARAGGREALDRLRRLEDFRTRDDGAVAAAVRRRHCLAVIAQELGFRSWPQAAAVISGEPAEDSGTLLYPHGAHAHWNVWSASYEEASRIRRQHGGYLLAYRRHFFITDRYFIETLGLDPADADWERMRRDWARPYRPAARQRLYGQLIRRRLPSRPPSAPDRPGIGPAPSRPCGREPQASQSSRARADSSAPRLQYPCGSSREPPSQPIAINLLLRIHFLSVSSASYL